MATVKELEAKLAELEARSRAAEETAAKATAALAAATAEKPRHSGITLKVSENAKCVSIYGLQTRPVTLYASQFVKLFGHSDEIKAFIIANADALAWKTADERKASLAAIAPTPAPTAEPVPATTA